MRLELRPRLATEIVDAAFQLYGRHFTALVTLSLAILAPYIILEYALTGGLISSQAEARISTLFVLPLVGWVFRSFAEAAIVVAVSNSYLNGEPDARGSLRLTLRRFVAILFAVLAKWLLIGVTFGLIFVVLSFVIAALGAAATMAAGGPGTVLIVVLVALALLVSVPVAVYLFARFFAVPATVVLEGLGVVAGLRRSSQLSNGMKRKILGALGLTMLAFFVIQLVFLGVSTILPGPTFLAFLFQKLPTVLISPILAVIATLLYYDARIRKEGFDIEMMAAELGSIGTEAAPQQLPVSRG